MKLHTKIALMIVLIVVVLLGTTSLLSYNQVKDVVEIQMGNHAMDTAATIADVESIQKALGTRENLSEIQVKVEDIRANTSFQYIIVLDMKGIKYSYPYEESVGEIYRSGGERRALKNGESYISADRNVLISAIRAFKPIYYNGKQVGAVIVGLLIEPVYAEVGINSWTFWLDVLIAIVIAIVAARSLSVNIKKSMYGLEPEEIAQLLGQRELELYSLDRGLISIDTGGKILFFNKMAEQIFDLEESFLGKSIEVVDNYFSKPALEALETNEASYNIEIKLYDGRILLCNYTPFRNYNDEVIGTIAMFQDLTEVRELAEELTGIKMMADALRAQNHEFLNKLHTISGLMQLEEYDEAIQYIEAISSQRRGMTDRLKRKIVNVPLAGLLLAKYNKASECKIEFTISKDSNLTKLPRALNEDEMCSIVGNLVENAIDELKKIEGGKIQVTIYNDSEFLNIFVRDNGPGIPKKLEGKIFQKGVTTKEGNRGFGLYLVKNIVDRAEGIIELHENNGVEWHLEIPMK